MTDLTIGGETFRVLVEGDPTRPPLMLSNSLGTTLSMWDGQVPVLARHFRVIRYDPRGHGGSSVDSMPGSIAQFGGDVLAILDALEIDKVHWLGLSMGGAVGLWLLVNAPDRIERAVLANTAPRLGTPETWNARITSVLAEGMGKNAAATIERWFSPDYMSRARQRVETVHAMLRGTSPQGYAAACAALRDMDLRASLGAITHEVLVVTGRGDPVIPDVDTNAMIAGISGARHAALEARHMSNIEEEADFNAAVVAFLTRSARMAREAAPSASAPRKSAPAKATPVKRSGGAGRRSNPARSPLKEAAAAKGTPTKRAPAKKPAVRKARGAAKTSEPHRRPAAKRSGARTDTKAATKRQAPKKATTKKTPSRRPTPTATARGPVKKAKPAKRGTAKAPVKKATAKAPTKKLPGVRRKPANKLRRPTGRRRS